MKALLIERYNFTYDSKMINESIKRNNGLLIVEGLVQRAEARNQNGRIYPINILKREVEKYIKGPIAENRALGELDHPECFIDGYSILTREHGWVEFKNLKGNEHVATINPVTQELEYQQIVKVINEFYEGDVVDIESKTFQATVTPTHRFIVTNQYDIKNNKPLKFKTALELCTGDLIPKKSQYNIEKKETVIIENCKGKLEISSNIFAPFMGWWLAEGWLQKHENTRGNISRGICLSQSKKENWGELDNIFENLSQVLKKKWSTHKRKNNEREYYILENTLYEYLTQFGKCDEKYVPKEIKELNKENIQLFLDAYLKGDGSQQKNQEVYYTTSKQMSLDISELINLTGYMSSCSEKELCFEQYLVEGKWVKDFDWYTKKSKYQGKTVDDRKKHYTGKTLYSIRRKYSDHYHMSDCVIATKQYSGNVHCVSVPNETILVMAPNGSTFWSGNSSIINLKNVSHNIKKLWWDGNDLMGRIEILPTPSGNILKTLFENNITVGISSRGMGSVQSLGEGAVEVQDDFEIAGWDFVSTPSTQGAFMRPINESTLYPHSIIANRYSKVNSVITDIICTRSNVCDLK